MKKVFLRMLQLEPILSIHRGQLIKLLMETQINKQNSSIWWAVWLERPFSIVYMEIHFRSDSEYVLIRKKALKTVHHDQLTVSNLLKEKQQQQQNDKHKKSTVMYYLLQ